MKYSNCLILKFGITQVNAKNDLNSPVYKTHNVSSCSVACSKLFME